MKKRFLSAAVAAILTVTGMATTAFAEGEVTQATAADAVAVTDASNTITVQEITSIPAINVTLPTTVAYVANPYRLTVKTGADTTSNAAIVSPELTVKNNGHSRVAVSCLGIGTPSGKANLISLEKDAKTGKAITAINTKNTTNDILLFIEPGTPKTTKVNGEDVVSYTFAGKYAEKNCCLIGSPTEITYYTYSEVTKEMATGLGVDGDLWDAADDDGKEALLKQKGVTFKTAAGGTVVVAAGTDVTSLEKSSTPGTATEVTLLTLDNADSTDAKAVKEGRIKISGDMNSNVTEDWADTDTVAISLKFNVKLLPNNVK